MLVFCLLRYHNDRMVNHDLERGQRVDVSPLGSHATLTLPGARAKEDSGNFTCSPQNVRPASVVVHVLDDDDDPKHGTAAAVHTDDAGAIGGGTQRHVSLALVAVAVVWPF